MDDYYWELTLMGGDKMMIPPEHVATIQRKWDAGEVIKTSQRSIPAHQITGFEKTSKRKLPTNLLEEVAQAFGEPIIRKRLFKDGTTDEAVSVKWVKKQVTNREWEKYYAPSGYKRINSSGGIVVIAFRMPTHLIDVNKVEHCTTDEIQKLTR